MIQPMKPEAQPTREERIVLALDQAHKNVSDALRDLYQLRRETKMDYHEYDMLTEPLRDILQDIVVVANRLDKEEDGR